jgi:DNA-directed RNA polymerase subunit K/omega
MIFPKLDILEHKINSKYLLAILVAKRARQIKEDSPRLPGLTQPHPITLALRELLEHEIKIVLDDPNLGINLCEEPIDVEELRKEAQAAYVALTTAGQTPDEERAAEADDAVDELDGEVLDEEEGVAGLDSLGEAPLGSKRDAEDL